MFASLLSLPLLLLMALPVVSAPLDLPNLNDSSSALLSTTEQQQLGRNIYHQLADAGLLQRHPIVTRYIQQLGERLVSQSGSSQPFTFFVVDAPDINAFAMLGGYIGVNSGLILASESESELASVIAHEIAHVTQNHLLRGVEKANKAQLPLTAALLAAILLGNQNPQLAQAAIASTIAGGQQLQLSFSRAHEQEADRLGVNWLADAGFDPSGMALFFQKLQQQSRYYSLAPEYLSTHPITTSRVSDARNRSEQYAHRPSSPNSLLFHSTRAILSSSSTQILASAESAHPPTLLQQQESQYTQALRHLKQHQPEAALPIIQRLNQHSPSHIPYLLTLVDTLAELNQLDAAVTQLRAILKNQPYHPLLTQRLARLQLERGEDQQAYDLLKMLLAHSSGDITTYQLIARIEGQRGNHIEAHFARAESYLLDQRMELAREELIMAKQRLNDDFYLQNRIEARLQELNLRLDKPRSTVKPNSRPLFPLPSETL